MPLRIISFSLYGTNPLYVQGALRNVRLAPAIYPGWTPRVYVSQEVDDAVVDELLAEGAEVVRKKRVGGIDGMFWRFLPAGDASLEAVIVRDTDSRPTKREAAAVRDWLASGKSLHIMRDHPEHRAPIMGGMWGCRGGAVPDIQSLIDRWGVWAKKGQDQVFLREVIYHRFAGDTLVHSDIWRFAGESTVPFPLPRPPGEFVGDVIPPDSDSPDPGNVAENIRRFEGVTLSQLPFPCRRPWLKHFMIAKHWVRSLVKKGPSTRSG